MSDDDSKYIMSIIENQVRFFTIFVNHYINYWHFIQTYNAEKAVYSKTAGDFIA